MATHKSSHSFGTLIHDTERGTAVVLLIRFGGILVRSHGTISRGARTPDRGKPQGSLVDPPAHQCRQEFRRVAMSRIGQQCSGTHTKVIHRA